MTIYFGIHQDPADKPRDAINLKLVAEIIIGCNGEMTGVTKHGNDS
jgi:hypothetical protein